MKTILLLLTLACAMAAVYGIVCTTDFCKGEICNSTVTEDSCPSPSEYRPNGSICGCCPVCITILGEGDRCIQLRGGTPPSSECSPDLECRDGVCVKVNVDD